MSVDTTLDDTDSGSKRLTSEEFEQIKDLYELDKMGVTELASKFGVSRQALSKRFKAEGITKGSRKVELDEVKKAAEEAATKTYAYQRIAMVEEYRMKGMAALKRAQMIAHKVIKDAMDAGLSLKAVDDDLKAVERYNKIIVANLTGQKVILDPESILDVDTLPSLIIEDTSQEDILEHRKNIDAIHEDATVEDMIRLDKELEDEQE